jgi:hypothetical protein
LGANTRLSRDNIFINSPTIPPPRITQSKGRISIPDSRPLNTQAQLEGQVSPAHQKNWVQFLEQLWWRYQESEEQESLREL